MEGMAVLAALAAALAMAALAVQQRLVKGMREEVQDQPLLGIPEVGVAALALLVQINQVLLREMGEMV